MPDPIRLEPWHRLARVIPTYETVAHQALGPEWEDLARVVQIAPVPGPPKHWAVVLFDGPRRLREWALPDVISPSDAQKAAGRLVLNWGIRDEDVNTEAGQDCELGAGDLDVILGGCYEVGGFWGKIWKGLKTAVKALYHNKYVKAIEIATVGTVATMFGGPVAGAAAALAVKKGVDLIDKAASGHKGALAQVKQIADKAKAGDKKYQPAHDMLKVINEVRKETKSIPPTAVAAASQLVAAANTGSEQALGQVQAITNASKAGDTQMQAAHELLSMVNLANKVSASSSANEPTDAAPAAVGRRQS